MTLCCANTTPLDCYQTLGDLQMRDDLSLKAAVIKVIPVLTVFFLLSESCEPPPLIA